MLRLRRRMMLLVDYTRGPRVRQVLRRLALRGVGKSLH